MSKHEYFGKTDLLYLVQLISTELDKYQKAVADKGLSANDFTNELKNKLDGIAEGAQVNVQADYAETDVSADSYIKNKPVIDSELDESSENAVSAQGIATALKSKANLNSPSLTGTPTAPTADEGDNSTQIATTAFTATAIANALADITGIVFDSSFDSYDDLVANGSKKNGVIYLIPNNGNSPNIKNEYFWTGNEYELFGTTEIDLSEYLKSEDITELSEDEVKSVWDSVFTS